MINKEKIHQILSSLWKNDDSAGKTYYNQALQDVQTTIDLQEEPVSEELEQAAVEAFKKIVDGGRNSFLEIFKTGAQWQLKQDQENIELAEDHAMFAGMEKMKEQMMKEAIDAQVLENYDGKVIKYDETILDEKLSDCKVFDKVKVIIIKED